MKRLRLWFATFPAIGVRGYFWAPSESDVRSAIRDSIKFNTHQERGEIRLAQKGR